MKKQKGPPGLPHMCRRENRIWAFAMTLLSVPILQEGILTEAAVEEEAAEAEAIICQAAAIPMAEAADGISRKAVKHRW